MIRRLNKNLGHLKIPATEDVEGLLAQLSKLEYFAKLEAIFSHYPPHTLLNAKSRAILYILTRFLKPNHVLEIGTYRAGSSEIIARALRSNEKGDLLTIDPFGQERVPQILDTWPAGLKKHINYLPLSSMDCFIKLASNVSFDIIFVDGDHSYEHALYDLQMAARYAVPGGIVIMDNVEQTGVYWAVKAFLSAYSGWRELGSSMTGHDIKNPFFNMNPSIPGSSFLILQAPTLLFINQHPRSFEIKNVSESGLAGFDFFFTGKQKEGYVNALIFFRSFMHGDKPGIEQESCIERFPISVDSTSHRIIFPKSFITKLAPEDSYRTYEIILTYTSQEGNELFELTSPPVPIKIK